MADIDLGREPVSDETGRYKLRYLMEQWNLRDAVFPKINEYLAGHGSAVSLGTTMDVTLVNTPALSKNQGQ